MKALSDSPFIDDLAIMDENGRVMDIVEKPSKPETRPMEAGIYIFSKRILLKIKEYVDEGLGLNGLGRFIE